MKNLTAISIFLFLFSTAAQAGYWTVTYVANGKDTDSQGTYNWPIYPTPEAGMEEWIYLGRSESASTKGVVSSGSIRPVFHWQEGTTGEQPPDKIAYLTSVKAIAGPFPPGAPGQDRVADCFEDQEYYDLPMWSMRLDGNHCRGISVPSGATTVYGPAFTVRASALMEPGQQGYAFTTIGCRVSVISLEISGTSTDGKQGALPPFFSGTNCDVQGDAELPLNTGSGQDAPQGFTEAYLYIGGAEVNRWIHTESTPPKNVSLSARFDSMHFPDGSDIPVMLRVKDDHGMVHDMTRVSTSKNRSLVISNQTLSFATPTASSVANLMSSMNHYSINRDNATKTELTSSALLGPYSVFHITTHGNPSPGFMDSFGPASENATQTDILQHMVTPKDIVLGNIKLPSQPSFNFVFIDCCHSAGDLLISETPLYNLAHDFFSINFPSETPDLIDRCFVGWGYSVRDNRDSMNWVKRFYSALGRGYPVFQSRIISDSVKPMYGKQCTDCLPWFWNYKPIAPSIYGDEKSKLNGLYEVHGLTWSMPIGNLP